MKSESNDQIVQGCRMVAKPRDGELRERYNAQNRASYYRHRGERLAQQREYCRQYYRGGAHKHTRSYKKKLAVDAAATRQGEYTTGELIIVNNKTLTALDVAEMLSRTAHSVEQKRNRLQKEN